MDPQTEHQEDEQNPETIEASPSLRDEAMASIAANARRQREEQPEDDEAEEAPEQQAGEELPIQEDAQGDEHPPEEMITIKVNGEEQQVPRSQVLEHGVRTLQKESAADRRLAEASELMRQAQSYEQQVKQLEQEILAKQEQSTGKAPSRVDVTDAKERARQVISKMMDGEEDEAADLLAEIMSGRDTATPPIDAQRIAAEAAELAGQRIETQNVLKKFNTDYQDILADPYLYQLTDQETIKIQQEHPDWGLPEILQEAGNRVRQWKGGIGGKETGLSETEQRKRGAQKPIRAASARAEIPPEQVPPTRSDVVANMRKQRGLE